MVSRESENAKIARIRDTFKTKRQQKDKFAPYITTYGLSVKHYNSCTTFSCHFAHHAGLHQPIFGD